jgi:two-component system response regulator FixJ
VPRSALHCRSMVEDPNMLPEPTVFVVDDDEALRRSMRRFMESVGLAVETFPSAEAFLAGYDRARPGCLVLDIRMPGMDGLALQEKLSKEGVGIPVIIVSGHADVEKAVRAMKTGAVDFMRKPYKAKVLLDRIRQALELDVRTRRTERERAAVAARVALLTPREREVMGFLAAGQPPKQIAFGLGLSRKTVDVHRGHIMTKMQAESLVELARLVKIYESGKESPSA